MTYRIVHYINQFYAGSAARKWLTTDPNSRGLPAGYADRKALQRGRQGRNRDMRRRILRKNTEEARKACLEMIKGKPDILCGAGFNAEDTGSHAET